MKKQIKNFILIGFLFFVFIECIIMYHGFKEENVEADYVIVLGARLYGELPSPALQNRLDKAWEYLGTHKNSKVVVTGGQGEDEKIAEAEAMKRYFLAKGVEKERILAEYTSTNTFENLKNASELIFQESKKKPNVLIVTNRFHIFRAKMLANRFGIEPYGYPAKTPPSILIPCYIREAAGIVKSFLVDRPE